MEKSKILNFFKINSDSLNRDTNFELLRIISMILIIAHHIAIHSGIYYPSDNYTLNKLWMLFLNMGGKVGVNIFILISGYFLVNTTKLKICKIIKLILQVSTYSIIFFICSLIFSNQSFSLNNLYKAFFPIMNNSWWFVSTYFVMFLLSPYINILLKNLSKKQYLGMLALITTLWSILPTISNSSMQLNNLLWFMLLYAFAGYIKLHFNDEKVKCWMYLAIFHTFVTTSYILTLFTSRSFFGLEQFTTLSISLSLFLAFKKINMPKIKIINLIATTTFGVYLIHDSDYLRYILWIDIFKNYSYANEIILIPYTILQIILVFTICSIIEFIRIHFIEKFYINPINKLSLFLTNKKDKVFE